MEDSKIVIMSLVKDFSGEDILESLRELGLELEMAIGQYALAMTTIMDGKECLDRLYESLKMIDKKLEGHERLCEDELFLAGKKVVPLKKLEISEAKECEAERIRFKDSIGRISFNEVCVYPPGVADLLPGEQISEDMIEYINRNIEDGHEVEGIEDGLIYCLKEHR
jgi:arginine/lysine/ornithine decarboxylase